MVRILFLIGSIFGFLAVALGAFGAHGLSAILSPEMKAIYETGNKYHFYHSIAIVTISFLFIYTERFKDLLGNVNISNKNPFCEKRLILGLWFFVIGIIIFSGSLYTIAITNMRWLGRITPIGGVSFLLGWLFIGFSIIRKK